ncbi:hypothetical protein PIB30_019061 [Stylosanthes scabra]|uniref:Uncharacterized protein n=1 Tax=Stylosanthes scabra TaxID=79078 RepID=A0ABU6T7Z2_9FABA|nr:hypothetical protein [Stylosanthes scabra]
MRQQAAKELFAARYNKKIKSRELEEGDLVLKRADIGGKMPPKESWAQVEKAPTKWSKCSEKEHINSAQLKGQRTKSPGAKTKALKLPQRATYKVVRTKTTAPHRTDHPVLSCKKHKLCAPTVKVKTSRQANLETKLCAPISQHLRHRDKQAYKHNYKVHREDTRHPQMQSAKKHTASPGAKVRKRHAASQLPKCKKAQDATKCRSAQIQSIKKIPEHISKASDC